MNGVLVTIQARASISIYLIMPMTKLTSIRRKAREAVEVMIKKASKVRRRRGKEAKVLKMMMMLISMTTKRIIKRARIIREREKKKSK